MIRFNKHLKKFLATFMCICMICPMLIGCGQEESVDDVVTIITDDETAETVTNESQEGSSEPVTQPPVEDTTTDEAYTFYAFINGDGLVSDKRGKGIFTKDARYTFQQMTEALHEYVKMEFDMTYLGDICYSFIDCGADGKQELALRFEFCREQNQAYGDYIQYLIISSQKDGLRLIYDGYSFNRYETVINEFGYVRSGGSDSAVSSSFSNRFVNADDKEVFLYNETYILGLEQPIIPAAYLSSAVIAENYAGPEFTGELGYSVTGYNFKEISDENILDEAKYDEYKKNNFFVISDPDGKDISKNAYDAKLYEEMGVEVIDFSDAILKIGDHEAECGVTSEIKEGKDIVWYSYDKEGAFKDYRYDNAVSVNKSAIEEQLKLLSDTQHIWRNDVVEKANSYVYYAVTDLDRNGRLEVVRSEYCYLPEFCKNRFYEVTPDYKSVKKMDYDVETMWAEGEESGSSHGLMNVNLPIYCFWNSQYGKDAPDYTGISYYYIIPTREVHDGYESIVKMALCANNSGRVFTDFVGYANMNSETGEVTYMDYNGFDSTDEEFAKAEFSAYSADTGWECDKVNWMFMSLDEDDDVLSKLTDSYAEYTHETIIRLY